MDKLDIILEKFNSMEHSLNSRMDKLEENLTKRIDEVEQGLSKRIDEVEQGLSKRIDGVEQGLTKRMDEMQLDIKMLDSRQTELFEIVSAVRDNQTYQRAQHDSMLNTISVMQGDIKEINEKIDHLSESQVRQDKILESLSIRSLEQETDIRELKRIK